MKLPTTRERITIRIMLFSLLIAVGFGCDSSNNSDTNRVTERPNSNVSSLFDVPALIGKNIDEVRGSLGTPADKSLEPPDSYYNEWDNRFHKRGYTLLVTFNPKTRQVIDFFVPTTDPSQKTNDYTTLLRVSNVNITNPSYLVTPVPIPEHPSEYTGIKITEK